MLLPTLAGVWQGGMRVFMVKCAIFPLRAFLARFNASLLIRVILPLCVGYQQVHQQPDERERRGDDGGYFTDGVFHGFMLWVPLCPCNAGQRGPVALCHCDRRRLLRLFSLLVSAMVGALC